MAQQRRLLDIIAEQQKQIADLTRMLNETKRYDNSRLDEGYMVSDHSINDWRTNKKRYLSSRTGNAKKLIWPKN